ncbi:hypothetical protein BOO71_0007546 [Deinococcus marmoris]|uniref:Uncharacterized protein n=1 Tax=Deinococcus marmoris TaxID=249408 RepID=A0A1U7NY97_9DEIO|nr:hypothetical protein BOO71_0007546 [Deinococcus marmoris]
MKESVEDGGSKVQKQQSAEMVWFHSERKKQSAPPCVPR